MKPEPAGDGRLRVFLCHASEDKPLVRPLSARLRRDGFEPWLDEDEILPGERWEPAIDAGLRASDAVVVCLSQRSVAKEGFVQREIRKVLRIADEKPDRTIYVLPAKLEPCDIPDSLSEWHWVDLADDRGYQRLVRGLARRAEDLGRHREVGPAAYPDPIEADMIPGDLAGDDPLVWITIDFEFASEEFRGGYVYGALDPRLRWTVSSADKVTRTRILPGGHGHHLKPEVLGSMLRTRFLARRSELALNPKFAFLAGPRTIELTAHPVVWRSAQLGLMAPFRLDAQPDPDWLIVSSAEWLVTADGYPCIDVRLHNCSSRVHPGVTLEIDAYKGPGIFGGPTRAVEIPLKIKQDQESIRFYSGDPEFSDPVEREAKFQIAGNGPEFRAVLGITGAVGAGEALRLRYKFPEPVPAVPEKDETLSGKFRLVNFYAWWHKTVEVTGDRAFPEKVRVTSRGEEFSEAAKNLFRRTSDGEPYAEFRPEPSTVAALVVALEDPSATVRRVAVSGLGIGRVAQTADAIGRAVRDADEGVRLTAIQALARLRAPAAIPFLMEAACDRSLRFAAIDALWQLTKPHSLAVIWEKESDDRGVLAPALEPALDTLTGALSDENEETRWRAATALRNLANPKAVPALKAALETDRSRVRDIILEALDRSVR